MFKMSRCSPLEKYPTVFLRSEKDDSPSVKQSWRQNKLCLIKISFSGLRNPITHLLFYYWIQTLSINLPIRKRRSLGLMTQPAGICHIHLYEIPYQYQRHRNSLKTCFLSMVIWNGERDVYVVQKSCQIQRIFKATYISMESQNCCFL